MKTTTNYLFALLFISSYSNANEVKKVINVSDYATLVKKENYYPASMFLPKRTTHDETDIYGNKVRSENLNDFLLVDTTSTYYRMMKRNERFEKLYGIPVMNPDSKNRQLERSSRFRK